MAFSHEASVLSADHPPLTILIVDDEPNIRKMLVMSLTTDGHKVIGVTNAKDAIAEASRMPFDLGFVDLRLGTETGLDLIPKILSQSPWIKLVVITAYASVDTAVEAMKRGAADYLPKPFTPEQVRIVVNRVAQLRAMEQRLAALQGTMGETEPPIDLESAGASMQRAIDLARQVAPTDATVLIAGESGTGKGVLARAIHSWSALKPENRFRQRSLVRRFLRNFLKASCSGTPKGPSPMPFARTPGGSPPVKAALFFSMKSAICRWNCSPSSCVSCRIANMSASARV